MAFPLIPIAAAVAHGTAHVLTKPWPWVFVGLWVVASKFDFGVFKSEVQDTLWSLWWVVALIIVGLIANSAIKLYISEWGQSKRAAMRNKPSQK
jgi:hypothetical protein